MNKRELSSITFIKFKVRSKVFYVGKVDKNWTFIDFCQKCLKFADKLRESLRANLFKVLASLTLWIICNTSIWLSLGLYVWKADFDVGKVGHIF